MNTAPSHPGDQPDADAPRARHSLFAPDKRTAKRNAQEARFRVYGLVAIVIALLALVWLLFSIFSAGLPAFRQTFIEIPVTLDAAILDKAGHGDPAEMAGVTTIGYAKLIGKALAAELAAKGIDIGQMTPKDLVGMVSENAAADLRDRVLGNPKLLGTTVQFTALANGRIDGYFKGRVTMETAARDNNTSPEKLALADKMVAAGLMDMRFNAGFLSMPDASDKRPEAAGLGVHLTLDLGGQAKFGPDVEWVDDPEQLAVDPSRCRDFYAEVRRYWPALADDSLQPGYAGIRPKLGGADQPAADFVISGPAEHGMPGLVNLFGIESPGLTSSLVLADRVAAQLEWALA
jgi:hypothetical protein